VPASIRAHRNVPEAGITDVIAAAGYQRDLVMEHLGGLERFAVEEEQPGTWPCPKRRVPPIM
jgi:hypothetical protein